MPVLTHRPSPGNINTPFGPRPKPTPTSPAIHYGQDYGWGNGKTIYAAADGVVIDYLYVGAYGNRLRIRHADGSETWYCHTASSLLDGVAAGQRVKSGQPVAIQGATGNVLGIHLHFELRIRGVAVNPEPYFNIGFINPVGEEIEVIEMASPLTDADIEKLLSYKFEWDGISQSLRAHLMKISANVWNDRELNPMIGDGATSRAGDLLFAAYREATLAHQDTQNLVAKLGLGSLEDGEFVKLLRAGAKISTVTLSEADRKLLKDAAAPATVNVDGAAIAAALATNAKFTDVIINGVVRGLVANAEVKVNLAGA